MTKVFIGSTKDDLIKHREAVRDAVIACDCQPVMMEYWPAMDANAVKACMDKVDESDIYIGIFAHRYGFCPAGSDISITEMEFNRATDNNLPRLCFLIDEKHPWQPDFVEGEPGKSKLTTFKKRINSELIRALFKEPHDLQLQVERALNETLGGLKKARPNCNFVPNPEHFVGRVDELAALRSALSTDGAVTAITALKGIGGIGKTTLACAYANQDDRFQLKLYACLGQNYRENMEAAVMETWIGGTFQPGTALNQMIAYTRQHLINDGCGTPVLLLIDDVWTETVNAARILRAAAPPNARVLITTRSEDVAAALDADTTRLDALAPDEGADLMLDLIRDQRAAATRADLRAISVLLQGHSLALTLAARQLRRNFQTRRVKELKDTLEQGLRDGDAFPDLKLERADAASKQDSVSLTLKLTLDALHADDHDLHEKRLAQFRALGALPPDLAFRARHIYAIWGEDDPDALDDFAAEGLITADETRDDWYTQHRLLRAYARAQLRENGELDAVEANHRKYLIDLAYDTFNRKPPETWWDLTDDLEQIHSLGNDLATRLAGTNDPTAQDDILHRLSEPPQENDSVGTRHASSSGPTLPDDPALLTACEDFAAAVKSYIFNRYIGAEGRRWLWAGLAVARARESQGRIRLFTGTLGSWHDQRGMKHDAIAYHEQSLEAARVQSDKLNEATTLSNIGLVWDDLGDKQKALDYYEQSLPLKREIGDKRGEAATLNNIGSVWDGLGDKQKALDYFEQALPLLREVGDKRVEAVTLNNIGLVWDDLGDKQKALDYYEQSLPLKREVGDKRGEATTLNNIGMVWDALGDQHKALDFYEQALPLKREVGDVRGEAVTLSNIATILWEQGDRVTALDYMQTARAIKLRIGISTRIEDDWLNQWQSEMGGE